MTDIKIKTGVDVDIFIKKDRASCILSFSRPVVQIQLSNDEASQLAKELTGTAAPVPAEATQTTPATPGGQA